MDVTYSKLCPVCGEDLRLREIATNICESRNVFLCTQPEDKLLEEFISFCETISVTPRKIQRLWARRLLRNESFAAVAPTGVGKTFFGVIFSLFLTTRSKRSYIIVPTTLLVNQIVDIIREYSVKSGYEININELGQEELKHRSINIAFYHRNIKKAERERFFKVINTAAIVITTTQFLSRHFEYLQNKVFDFIFVDDVDAILKSSKNIEKVLKLLGFTYDNGWKRQPKGCLMVSTATARVGKKAELFRSLLNFDIGSSSFALRNISDLALKTLDLNSVMTILTEMGEGGIIYTCDGEKATYIYDVLKDKFKIGIVTAERKGDFQKFTEGQLDYLIGTASYYGSLVRGLDLPLRIRFVIFYGAPVFRIKIENIENISEKMVSVLAYLFRDHEEIKKFLPLTKLSPRKLNALRMTLKNIFQWGEKGIKDKDVVVTAQEIIFPDIRTYIQGSGRTSRLYAGGVTKGVSFLLEDDDAILQAFINRARYYDIEFQGSEISEIEFNSLREEVDRTREKFKLRGEVDVIKPALFIVESPTKVKHISRFFGKPSIKIVDNIPVYEVATSGYILMITACLGHVTDLIVDRGFHGVEVNGKYVPIYSSLKRCKDCNYQFSSENTTCPKCGSSHIDDSRFRINTLRKLARDTQFVIIGTDPDSEGEKISWDLKNLLAGCGEIKRAEFHEVTRKAVFQALDNLREININLVRAQIVRRIEDRWIGFILSQKLWEIFNDRNLSAGRAQTPVLGWIIKRAEEFKHKKDIAVIPEWNLVLDSDKKGLEIEIRLTAEEQTEKTPLPPYTTDTLLRDANVILKFPARKCMELAQDLFENGLITYHRTGSTRVSDVGFRIASEYLKEDFVRREWFTEGAHECIRPARAVDKYTLQRLMSEGMIQAKLNRDHLALYDLIFRRFMASQCKNYFIRIVTYKINYDGNHKQEERVVKASGRSFQLYRGVVIKPSLPLGKFRVSAKVLRVPQAPLFSQSDVIQHMKEKGIGRPSTYAAIIERLFIRKYIIEKNNKIYPTSRGVKVYNYLINHYADFLSEERTRALEEKMDEIEKARLDYYAALQELYNEVKTIK